jgi:polyferredoxin
MGHFDLELVLLLIMGGMALSMGYTIMLSSSSKNILQRLVVYIILAMMNSMLLAPFIYLAFPGLISIDRAVELALLIMVVEIAPFLISFTNSMFRNSDVNRGKFLLIFLAFFVIFDEILMSMDFNIIISGTSYINILHSDPVRGVFQSISSYWFVFPMSIEMFFSVFLMRKSFNKASLIILATQAAIMLFAPTAINNGIWAYAAVFISGFIMTGLFVFFFEHLYRVQGIRGRMADYIIMLLFAYTIIICGVFLWQIYSSYIVFSSGMIIDMVVYIRAAGDSGYLNSGKKVYWLANRNWSFLFLAMVFAAEFFMGAAFDAQYYGASNLVSTLGLVSIGGGITGVISSSIYDFFRLFADISLSAWFYIMMGIEMGSLVLFKIRKTRDLETKIRLSFMLLAYAVYSIIIPSFVVSNVSVVPFVGWTMGIGSGGGLAPALIIPMVLTYVISGILSLLFGSRQLCSTFCTAPVMYQGTFYDSMKGFNKSSGKAKSLTMNDHAGRMTYRVVSNTIYAMIIITGIISWLDYNHYLNITIYGTDPLYMLYLFLFGFLWYAVFITMPYVGSYGCINTGYCHWGNFNRFISRFGFFRLKVRDPIQCVNCKTKDCTLACPVGNYGQAGSFIEKGEYRDSRCVGIGDCVNACPYENIFYYDVRHFIKERMKKGSS